MGLSDIAAGLEVTHTQQDRGVAATDGTDRSLSERLEAFEERLPCSASTAARLVSAYSEGASVGRAAATAELPKTTATKTLYLLGEPIDPLTPTATDVLDSYLDGELSRTEARTLVGVGRREFVLAEWIATHEPIDGIESVVADALSIDRSRDPLSDARGGIDDWG
ncbi:MAG: hypothetical protein PPP58_10590 [Natronomonas sp.]